PTRKPRYMSVVTDPMTVARSLLTAAPPARASTVGARTEHPAPASTRPARATAEVGATPATAVPAPAITDPVTSSLRSDHRSRRRFPPSRPAVMAAAHSAGPRPLNAAVAPSVGSRYTAPQFCHALSIQKANAPRQPRTSSQLGTR